MSADDGVDERHLPVGETADGESLSLPTEEVLTGRAFITGKSGSGKSNSVSVVIEELLERQYPVLVVDTDGEYYGLKEEYELLHAGADDGCDIQVSPEHAERLATIALEENVPVILDVSGFLDEDAADELVFETAKHLFAKEKKLKKPFLLVVEEVHEYIPEGAGMGETGRMLIKVGKRGRKHGLGVVGISQRPADVKKDFITQANWLVWHRLTWENDTKVVGRIVGSEYEAAVSDLDAGEAFVQADWTDEAVERVQFKRKRTFDAGATPGLDDFERPELKSVSDTLVEDLADIRDAEEQRQDRIAELERRIENREERIAELETELDRARDVSAAARKLANAVAHGDADATAQARVDASTDDTSTESAVDAMDGDDIATLRDRVAELESRLAATGDEGTPSGDEADGAGAESGEANGADDEATTSSTATTATDVGTSDAEDNGDTTVPDLEAQLAELGAEGSNDAPATSGTDASDEAGARIEPTERIGDVLDRLQRSSERERTARTRSADGEPVDVEAETTTGKHEGASERDAADDEPSPAESSELLAATAVRTRLDAARRASQCNETTAEAVYEHVADMPRSAQELVDATGTSMEAIHTLLVELRGRDMVVRDGERRYAFHEPTLRDLVRDPRAERGELGEQWRIE
ncbi:helicase HerA domain-containing protein [Halarchaeum salinum]|uniref:Helicase HerA central domain-containing protein n=1 Tax=Halarchaeum salinum TaxID=489912 RepID=A0AAV3S5V4_9EURY